MKRRIGSFFYKAKTRTEEHAPKRWYWPAIIGGFLRKACIAIGALVLFSIFMGLLLSSFIGGKSSSDLPDDMVLVLNVEKPIGETEAARSLTAPLASDAMTVEDVVATFDRASVDKRVKGILVSLDNAKFELAHIQELRAAVKRFRKSGKFAYIYTASFADLGSGVGAYYFASAFDKIWMQPSGFVSMTGLSLEMPFAKDLLDKVGAQAQFLHREEYKSAMESFTNTHMSGPNQESLESIVTDFSTQIFVDISNDRKLSAKLLQAQFDKGFITGDDALKAGLIDRVDYSDILMKEVTEKITGKKNIKVKDEEALIVMAEDYFDATIQKRQSKSMANVALVRIAGEIIPGADPEPGYATGDYIASAIQEAADNPRIKVIVVRVDSPGGSPSASETIRRAIVYAKEHGKKILVSMGPVAASGGYWLTVDADKIFALPTTLTGSIGVVMGKFEISGLWKKVGINWDAITWGKNARLWSMNTPLNDSEKASLNAAIDDTYKGFITRVAKGRKMTYEKAHSLAKGRAWTGLQAKENGLVDEIGGLDSTMDYAAKLVGVSSRLKLRTVVLPEPLTRIEQIMSLMGEKVSLGGFDLKSMILMEQADPMLRQIKTIERSGPVQVYDPSLTMIHS